MHWVSTPRSLCALRSAASLLLDQTDGKVHKVSTPLDLTVDGEIGWSLLLKCCALMIPVTSSGVETSGHSIFDPRSMTLHRYFVYILRCADGTYYTGVTNDVERRLGEHNAAIDPYAYAASRRPVKLVHVIPYADIREAIGWEKRIKRWSASKKQALIRGDWDELAVLAQCRNDSSHHYYRG